MTSQNGSRRSSRWARVLLAGVAVMFFAGCIGNEVDPLNPRICATLKRGNQPIQNRGVRIDAVLLHRQRADVYQLSGDYTTDMSGLACMNLSCVNCDKLNHDATADDIREYYDLKTLKATLDDGEAANGVITEVDIDTWEYPYVEALFDFDEPNPGDPGTYAMLNLLNRANQSASKISSRVSDRTRPRAGEAGPAQPASRSSRSGVAL